VAHPGEGHRRQYTYGGAPDHYRSLPFRVLGVASRLARRIGQDTHETPERAADVLGPNDVTVGALHHARSGACGAWHTEIDVQVGELPRSTAEPRGSHAITRGDRSNTIGTVGALDDEGWGRRWSDRVDDAQLTVHPLHAPAR